MTILSYSMIKIACLNDAFPEIFELEASPEEEQSLQHKDKNGRKRKGKKKFKNPKSLKTKRSPNFDFCACQSKHVLKCHASGKKGVLSCCKFCRLELIWLISRLNIS